MTAAANQFLAANRESADLNQYWYSSATIAALVQQLLDSCGRAAFLSTPSVFFSLPEGSALRATSWVFDLDEKWSGEPHFCRYDFKQPEHVPAALHGTFDCAVIDPPFITPEVWRLYAQAAKLLLKPGGHVLCSTIQENAPLMQELFGAWSVPFKPAIPHLVYQYQLFTTLPTLTALGQANPEVPED